MIVDVQLVAKTVWRDTSRQGTGRYIQAEMVEPCSHSVLADAGVVAATLPEDGTQDEAVLVDHKDCHH